jgi:hypothetical protein
MVLPIPPAITVEMAKGFTLYMVDAVTNGRGDDLVDLAPRRTSGPERSHGRLRPSRNLQEIEK